MLRTERHPVRVAHTVGELVEKNIFELVSDPRDRRTKFLRCTVHGLESREAALLADRDDLAVAAGHAEEEFLAGSPIGEERDGLGVRTSRSSSIASRMRPIQLRAATICRSWSSNSRRRALPVRLDRMTGRLDGGPILHCGIIPRRTTPPSARW